MKQSIEFLREAMARADKKMKDSNGHSYVSILKTRCQNCGRSPKQKGKCSGWFTTFVNRLEGEYLNQEIAFSPKDTD